MNTENNSFTIHKAGEWLCLHWKQIFAGVFKTALIALAVFAIYIACVIISVQREKKHGECGGSMISEQYQIYSQHYADDTQRLRDLKSGRWTTPRILWAAEEPLGDSISVYCDRKGRRGFYNTHTGKITIPGAYRHAWYFSDGVAAVVGDDGRIRFIAHDGTQAVPGSYHYSRGHDVVFKGGLCELYNDSTKTYGLLRKDGTWALEQVYQRIVRDPGVAVTLARRDWQWQLFDSGFKPVFEETFDAMRLTGDNDGVYVLRNHIKQKLDFQGNVIEPFIIDDTRELRYMVKYHEEEADEYELVPEVVVYKVESFEGLMDKRTGRVLTPAIYRDFKMISRDLIKASYANWQYESVVMDLRGRIVRQE